MHFRPSLFALSTAELAGMPVPFTLNDIARMRVEAISFFLVVLLISAALIRLLWNGLRDSFPRLPKLSYGKALSLIILWGLLFAVVLAMITGARELMTPGAWGKTGLDVPIEGRAGQVMRISKRISVPAITLAVLLFLTCLGIEIPGIEIVFRLAVGWIAFLARVVPLVHIRWDLAANTALYAALLIVGSHWFLRWFYRETTAAAGSATAGTGRPWQWRWTLTGFLVVILMFASGMAAIGVVHQTAWLVTSPKPIYERTSRARARDRVRCASNLRQIAMAIEMYAVNHGGKYPDDLASLLVDDDVYLSVFVCPATDDQPAVGTSGQERAQSLRSPGHCSYLYFGKGLSRPTDANRVVATEPLANHSDSGINVLYGDGRVDWLLVDDAQRLLDSLGVSPGELGSATTRPVTVPTTGDKHGS